MHNQNPTVLHAFPIWLPQTQTWMYSQVAELQRLGMDAHVVCERTENLNQFSVANIHCLADEPEWSQALDKSMRKFRLRRHLDYLIKVGEKIDTQIVHSHFGNIGWANLGAVRKLGAKHVVTFYGLDVNKLPQNYPIWRKRYQKLFQEADLFLCEGPHMARCLVELGCSVRKIQVQHLGVNVESYEVHPRWLNDGEPLKVLIAASFREKKGIPYAVEALGALNREFPIELTIIGDAGEDPDHQKEKERILAALKRNGLESRTKLLGYQPHSVMLREAYKHHIFLQPSLSAEDGDTEGGAPVSIIEMLATGMIVVSTSHCDIPEVFPAQLRNTLAQEGDVYSLIEKIKLVLNSKDEWVSWADMSSDYIIQEFNLTNQTKKLMELYKSLANS